MAVVLSSEDNDLFSSSLKRSHSHSAFVSNHSHNFRTSASTSRISDLFHENYHHQSVDVASDSSPSSAHSSPRTLHADSFDPSYSSTPATNLSLDGQCEDDTRIYPDDPLLLLGDDHSPYFVPLDGLNPPISPPTGGSAMNSPSDHDTPTTASHAESPGTAEHAEDDTAIRHHPTQHVDYLSHNWKEEDIWSSWRYIVSKRGEMSSGLGPRLENASWRTWMKAKNRLRTISPETLNWLKDCDVTWLYGPLQTRHGKLFPNDTEQGSSTLSRSDSFIRKKPILKKRSMSELMLQRSLSSSSLLKQATAVVQAQQKDGSGRIARPVLHRAATDYITFPFSSRRRSRENTSLLPSTATSGGVSPSAERRHIHFDEQVKQCIAVDVKGDEEDEDEVDHCRWRYDEDSDSDDGAIMMKKTNNNKKPIILRRKPATVTNSESKTIAMLPSTTLKYREDSPAPPESAMKHSTGSFGSPALSPSSSQETLRPSKASGAFFVGEDEGLGADTQSTNSTPNSSPVDSMPHSRPSSLQRSTSTSDLIAEPAGMRRTESGMLMPYEEGDAQPNEGIVGRVIDTVNTARDIAHVIWNVGWRR
ncbi:Uu.00g045640.m01.CDS01 [Anthostomella pinea]|uniref:Uu.00g045640.m01.CDS01 n=1 Tax=Anthostomella pinea TaxID=933095 RepID=A0AAI8VB81_9PEZI|nr:Uu.00g045640.m01.CDS01 [Anthostomella pinea]